MNMLLLSVGTRNKVVQFFKETISGCVITTDASSLAPALYEADRHYIVPAWNTEGYLDIILKICDTEHIDAVMSLIDPELSFLAANEAMFKTHGVTVIGSPYELCERALDKMQMYEWLEEHGYDTAKSYMDKEAFYADMTLGTIQFPVFVKPVRGSASIAISKVEDKSTLDLLWSHTDGLMIQEYLKGQEIGADCYIDMISGEVVSIFTKKKLLMRAGETDKAVSFKDQALFELLEKFIMESGWKGQIDIDIFNVDGKYYISEVNPRFGGGYPHAYLCGCNHIKLIENNINGVANPKAIGLYDEGIYMMKYNEIAIMKNDGGM